MTEEEAVNQFCSGCSVGVVGAVILMLALGIVFTTPMHVWRQQAIKHGAARYNATTGSFEWIDKPTK